MTAQRFITDFFKPKRKQLITDYFKPKNTSAVPQHGRLFPYNPNVDYKQSRAFLQKRKSSCDAIMTRNGYCFCATANFSDYAVYTTTDRLMIIAGKKHLVPKGMCIATAKIDNDSALEHIQVSPLFRRQGIGKKLIRFIDQRAPQFHVFAGIEHNSRYRLTDEGVLLIRSCQKAGILSDEQVILNMVPPSPSSVYG